MSTSRRDFIRNMGAGIASVSLAAKQLACAPPTEESDSEKLLIRNPDHPEPAPVGYDRLPLGWYKETVNRLKEQVAEKGVDVILLENRWNLIYFTGLFHSTTERPFCAVFPVKDDAIYWYHPGLDRDLVTTWWCTENEYYFDYPHAEGGFPNLGKVVQGKRADLFAWLLEGLKKRGFGEKTIGVDSEFTPSRMNKAKGILPKASFVDISSACLKMRMVKTKEEIALFQRAMNYSSKMHAFARDYLLQRGTEATDFEIRHAATEYGTNLILKDIERDGRPHSAVGLSIRMGCRTGMGTAFPHPNQLHHNKVKKGDSLQITGGATVGGYGSGCFYRYFQLAPSDAHREKLWQVVTDCVNLEVEEAKPGKTCSDVAHKVHQYQVQQGVEKYIYHRPSHGKGMEGHQHPFIALGDYTVLEPGMMFSVEPGLYDPENGLGYNPSDTLLITEKGGLLMSSVPFSKEWMFVEV